MSKKSDKKAQDKRFKAECLTVSLLQECYERKNKTCNAGDNSHENANTFKATRSYLPAVLADKAALVEYSPTFIGYCKAILTLVKAAFSHKMRKRFIVIGW